MFYFALILYLNTTGYPLLRYPRILLGLRVGDNFITRSFYPTVHREIAWWN